MNPSMHRPRRCQGSLCALWLTAALGSLVGSSVSAQTEEAHVPPDGASELVPVVITIEAPASTEMYTKLWITGDGEQLGSWNGRGLLASPVGPYTYQATIEWPIGEILSFSVTRGSWDEVECRWKGQAMPKHAFHVTRADTANVVVEQWCDVAFADEPSTFEPLSSDIRVYSGVESQYVWSRDVLVYLPPTYHDDTDARFPVLYLNDGWSMFAGVDGDASVQPLLGAMLDDLIRRGEVEPLIVVGVAAPPNARMMDYTWVQHFEGTRTNADGYHRFLAEELKPFIDQHYRTLPDREHTGIAGASLGGLVSLHFGLQPDGEFGRVAAMSPSVWWADETMTQWTRTAEKSNTKVWLDMGTNEGNDRAIGGARRLRDALQERGWEVGEDLSYLEVEGGVHTRDAFLARFDEVARFLYPPSPN
ncbi:MAG: alpha/beta hydrolase [Candidatus Eisenbacteria bacterium]|uniref:Alpha/beta hydrolase n=1 Tax=Eiseniibacteriota bacterium TaxID=2212470 RepID=A0A956NJ18_UNCEI|nr:alpha/beta hydrolase [Candidatus Eisenbacteria bacterium]